MYNNILFPGFHHLKYVFKSESLFKKRSDKFDFFTKLIKRINYLLILEVVEEQEVRTRPYFFASHLNQIFLSFILF